MAPSDIKRRDFIVAGAAAAAAITPASAEPQPEHHRIWADENERNTRGAELFRTIVSEAFKPSQFVAGHHLIYQVGNEVQEFPSADTLIFNHDVARVVWGSGFKDVLVRLVCEPVATRDALLADLLAARDK